MTGTIDPLGSAGVMCCISLLPQPYRTAWEQVALVEEGDGEIVFACDPEIVHLVIAGAPKRRQAMRGVHCTTPRRYKIKIQTADGAVACI